MTVTTLSGLQTVSENEFLCNEHHHLNEFGRQCKIDSYVEHVTQEKTISFKKDEKEKQERRPRKEKKRNRGEAKGRKTRVKDGRNAKTRAGRGKNR